MTHTDKRVHGFGIVGCGVIGPRHAEAIAMLENAHLVAVTDVIGERADALAAQASCEVVPDLDAMLARDDVDVVSVCVPSGMHAAVGIAAARAGKHLVIEKPIEVTLAAADALVETASRSGVKMTVISQHRFDPGVARARRLIDTGRLGRLVLGDARVKWFRTQDYYDSADWRGTWALDGGGALINQGVHYTDLLIWCMGPVAEVRAIAATQLHEIEVEDVALALFRFASGAVGCLEATTAAYPGFRERLEITGSNGSVVVEDGAIVVEEIADEGDAVGAYGRPAREADAGSSSAAADPAAVGADAHAAQIADLLEAIDSDGEPAMTGEAARDTLEVVLAVYESARTGEPVRLRPI